MPLPPNDSSYWDALYLQGHTAWDVGEISTPLKEYIDQYENKNAAILIPGCGNAYEAAYLLQAGFTNITLVDISSVAIEKVRTTLKAYEGKQLRIICDNFFKLASTFDLVLEQTFFCALDPALRPAYAQQMFKLLTQGGKLAGVLFNRTFEAGPPFGGSEEEYRNLFAPHFGILTMQPCVNSIKPREGSELFFILKKKSESEY